MFYSKILDHDNGIVEENFVVNCKNADRLSIKLLLINKEKYNIDLYKYNYIDIIYNDNINTSLININENAISSNLTKITDNVSNISSNLTKELNQNKTYLKNLENIILYDKKTQVDFRGIFFKEIFEVNAKKNDFIEINLKYLLEYENIAEKNYVNIVYEIFDENNNSSYISTINNNDPQYFSNKVFVDENIFYNFTKNVKNIRFKIKFVMKAVKVIKIWYIKNDNNRFIL